MIAYVRGEPGTPYQVRVSFDAGQGGMDYTSIAWTNPGWAFYHRYTDGTYGWGGSTTNETIQFKGVTYSRVGPNITDSAGVGYGNTGPNQAPFIINNFGTMTMVVTVDNLLEKPDLTCEVESFRNEIPGIEFAPRSHPDSRTQLSVVNGPLGTYWAANLKGRPVIRVENLGGRSAVGAEIEFLASFDNGQRISLGRYPVPEVLPGQEVNFSPSLEPLESLGADRVYGPFTLTAVVDPTNAISEVSELNNDSNLTTMHLVDPRPVIRRGRQVASEAAGYALLESLGFQQRVVDLNLLKFKTGWGLPLSGEARRSFYDGMLKPAESFRVEGKVVYWDGKYYVLLQGSNQMGEPNPTYWYYWSNPLYVWYWHVGGPSHAGF